MSLLIKALDKAQEQAQEVKAKQEAEKASAAAPSVQKTLTPKSTKEKSTNTAHNSKQKLVQTEILADKTQALSFEVTRSNIDMRIAESVVAIDRSADGVLSLSPKDSQLSEAINHANAPIKPALSVQANTAVGVNATANSSKNASTNASAIQNTSANQNSSASMAANVFNAKRVEASHQNTKLALLAGMAFLVLLAIGGYFYWQLNMQAAPQMSTPPLQGTISAVTPPAPLLPLETVVADTPAANQPALENTPELAKASQQVEVLAENLPKPNVVNKQKKPAKTDEFGDFTAESTAAEATPNMASKNKSSHHKLSNNQLSNNQQGTAKKLQIQGIASDSAAIHVTKGSAQAELNPTVMRAYEAYNAGSYTEAQKLYKQVLQRDVRNVDALLGLGAIASRQGRLADANGWYGKVLELEPRNSIAQAALVSRQSENQADYASADDESQFKNMLAKQPDDANLHAALGSYYADKNQWPSAQQAYFDAYRLNPTGDNAFNLAVSLDQMRKPKLALPYYQRALALADNASNLDKAAIEARILAIE